MHKTNHPFTEHYQASVWDVDPRLTDTRSVEMTVMRLRDKLGTVAAAPLETLRSQGYRWNSSFVS